jgi:hypothetical protein
MLAHIPQARSSWALPISTERLQPDDTEANALPSKKLELAMCQMKM